MSENNNKVILFDTTMRDGELTPGVKMNLKEKIRIAQLLEAIGIDIIEVGYPGRYAKDFEEISQISQVIKNATICGLAGSNPDEILAVANGIAKAEKGRIHIYNSVNLNRQSGEEEVLSQIKDTVTLARNYSEDVEWSAFDATRSHPDFLYKSIETAINSGATTINIPDTLGLSNPEEFSKLIANIFNQVPNIDKAIVSVHCHDDLGLAVANSIAALDSGARQIECAINGLGARKGNADLEEVVMAILDSKVYDVNLDTSLIKTASELVTSIAVDS
ncbi:MAG TPA: 2-isopropylmalate synthase [Cyanobacteria bacterium UBA11149]|nr:2-isopropylmalate synthase [Cyanobacteria bacterium UBA11367]HBE61139.1 2-isopropylmalate synthase [Cyanobacteria bacterium UBA11366]HBR75845.1 2-isopropylmalate synthase [Cyanobacteria bacterium UBA11159]HBW88466.1 2-isopropylmalate synthase [Cyanobacteria bacterium UBA11149]HCA97792.1 2-isopropylmalate synthase [Cyanobacteria bacterium UBA9226]